MVRTKYNSRKIVVEGEKFDSKREYDRYQELLQDKTIKHLKRQVKFVLIEKIPKVQREISYVADFTYEKNDELIVEDVKSKGTIKDKVFQLKKKLFRWKYGFDITIKL